MLSTLLAQLIENPKAGALTSGATAFGGYGMAKIGTTLGDIIIDAAFLQIFGVISMSFGMVVGAFTLYAAIIKARADKAKNRYYKHKCDEDEKQG